MRYATTAIVMAAISIGEAVAGPAHAHLHRKVHEKKDVDWADLDWDAMGINWAEAYSKGLASTTTSSTAAPTVAATTPTSAAAVSTSAAKVDTSASVNTGSDTDSVSSDVSSSVESALESLFDNLVGVSNNRTSFGETTATGSQTGDSAVNNYGNPYGSNVMKVDSIDGYDYTANFINTQSVSVTVNVWNKVGSNKEPLSGSALAPHDTTLTVALAPGANQIVAFDENSQISWAESCSATAASGAFATTWGEANLCSTGSGYDVSAIMNPDGSNYNMTITSLEAPDCTSSMSENYWLTATDPVGDSDGSCYIATSTATLTVIMGGTV